MFKSGPSTSGARASSPHIVTHDLRVFYCKYDTVKGYIFGKEYSLWEVGIKRTMLC